MTSQNNSPTSKDQFLALRYREILEAVLESTKDSSSSSKKTANSVIQELIRPNMEFYEKMTGPTFQEITVENCTVHRKGRSYECKVCGITQPDSTAMKDHINIKHLFLKPYICEECDISCASLSNLRKHQKNAHFQIHEDAIFFEKDKKNDVAHAKFKKKDRLDIEKNQQQYMITWIDKKTDEVKDMSIDVTGCKDVKVAARQLFYRNALAAENETKGIMDSHGCSYVQQFLDEWTFDPEKAIPLPIYSSDEPTGRTMKYVSRLVTNSKCEEKCRKSLRWIQKCENQFLQILETVAHHFPDKNRDYFNKKKWTKEYVDAKDVKRKKLE